MELANTLKRLGTLSLINFGQKHAEKLEQHAKAEVKARAAVIRAATGDLDAAYAARRPLQALWSKAVVGKDGADDALDDLIRALSYDLLAPAQLAGDRAHASYRALFPAGNIHFISGPDRAELAQVGAIVDYLKAHADHPMASRAAALETAAAKLEAALAPLAAAEAAFRGAQAIESEKRDLLRRALRKSATFLRDQLDGDEHAVQALFPPIEARAEPEGEVIAPAPAEPAKPA
jgi:hypothetical protein